MKKRNHTLRGGAVRCALALTLAVGLVPVQAISAVAAAEEAAGQTEAADQPEQIVSETVELSGAASAVAAPSGEGDQAAAEGSAADASSSESGVGAANSGAQAAAPAAAQQTQSARVASDAARAASASAGNGADRSDVDIVSASVQLSSAATIVAYSGMSFLVDDAERTATLVGIANNTLQGQLTVPAEVQAAGTTYTVANISTQKSVGGGVH